MKNAKLCFTCHELTERLDTMSKVGNTNFNKGGFQQTYFKIQTLKNDHLLAELKYHQNAISKDVNYRMLENKGVIQPPLSELKEMEEKRQQTTRQSIWEKAKAIYQGSNSATKAHKDISKHTISKQFDYRPQDSSRIGPIIENHQKPIKSNHQSDKCLTLNFTRSASMIMVTDRFAERKGYKIDTGKDLPPERPKALDKHAPSMTMNKSKSIDRTL